MPLHPLFVHFPLVIALLSPLAVFFVFYTGKENCGRLRTGVMALYLLLAATAFVAMNFGEEDEERVERVVAERIIERHAEKGELFAWSSLAPLLFSTLLMYRRDTYTKALLLASSVGMMALALPVGHSGAELVYRHNAGAAYWSAGAVKRPERHGDGEQEAD